MCFFCGVGVAVFELPQRNPREYQGSRVAAFSSGITIAFTLALVIVNMTLAFVFLNPGYAVVSCSGLTPAEVRLVTGSGVGICSDLDPSTGTRVLILWL